MHMHQMRDDTKFRAVVRWVESVGDDDTRYTTPTLVCLITGVDDIHAYLQHADGFLGRRVSNPLRLTAPTKPRAHHSQPRGQPAPPPHSLAQAHPTRPPTPAPHATQRAAHPQTLALGVDRVNDISPYNSLLRDFGSVNKAVYRVNASSRIIGTDFVALPLGLVRPLHLRRIAINPADRASINDNYPAAGTLHCILLAPYGDVTVRGGTHAISAYLLGRTGRRGHRASC
jgi:hypothetical protein